MADKVIKLEFEHYRLRCHYCKGNSFTVYFDGDLWKKERKFKAVEAICDNPDCEERGMVTFEE